MRWRRTGKPQSIPLGTYRATLLQRTLHLTGDDAKSHIHVIGNSGSGKSRWLAGFCRNLLRAGFSFTLIDPHGDLARLVLHQLVADGYFDHDEAFETVTYLDIPGAAKQGRPTAQPGRQCTHREQARPRDDHRHANGQPRR